MKICFLLRYINPSRRILRSLSCVPPSSVDLNFFHLMFMICQPPERRTIVAPSLWRLNSHQRYDIPPLFIFHFGQVILNFRGSKCSKKISEISCSRVSAKNYVNPKRIHSGDFSLKFPGVDRKSVV